MRLHEIRKDLDALLEQVDQFDAGVPSEAWCQEVWRLEEAYSAHNYRGIGDDYAKAIEDRLYLCHQYRARFGDTSPGIVKMNKADLLEAAAGRIEETRKAYIEALRDKELLEAPEEERDLVYQRYGEYLKCAELHIEI